MQISVETLKKWSDLKERGDIGKLCKKAEVSRTVLWEILNTGKCPARKAAKIASFYSLREREIKKIHTEDDGN